jgi:trigger factor
MLKHVEETSPTTRKLIIDIPSSIIEEEISNAYNRLRGSAKVSGFRVGKVPQAILEKKFGKDIEAKVLEKVVPEYYSRAVEEAGIFPVSFPSIEGNLQLAKTQSGTGNYHPLSFSATMEIKPEIKDLSYENISLKEQSYTVEDHEVETALSGLQESRAFLQATEKPLKEGDMAVIDCDAFIDKQEVSELRSRDYPFILGSPGMPKDFSDALAGKKKADSLEIPVQFSPDMANKTVAGKKVFFQVTIKETKEKILPHFDAEFSKGFQCSDMEELRGKIKENIDKQKKKKRDDEYKKGLVDHLVGTHTFEVPRSMVLKELESLIEDLKQDSMMKGQQTKSDEELRREYESAARKNVRTMLILDTIGKKEKIEVTEDDMNQAVKEVAAQHNIEPEEVKKLYIAKEGSLDGLKHRLYSGKVLDFLLSRAVIEKEHVIKS